jgi:uncharacterized membrane protein (UPF0136 family)
MVPGLSLAGFALNSVLVLSAFMLVGGIIGFRKAKSKASLIAGVASSLLLAGCVALSSLLKQDGALFGLIGAFAVTVALDVVFVKRLRKTQESMPVGILLFTNIFVQIIIFVALTTVGPVPFERALN